MVINIIIIFYKSFCSKSLAKFPSVLIFNIFFVACTYSTDPDLIQPDGDGNSYLTPLGCLINGPWEIRESDMFYNTKVFHDDSEILSKASSYTEMQKNLVFELHKNRTITYWLKNEIGSTNDTIIHNETMTIINKPPSVDQLKKIHNNGFWEVNLNDSTVLIHFENSIPDLKLKYSSLGNGSVNFQQFSYFDSVINGKKVILKKINTFHYETQFYRF